MTRATAATQQKQVQLDGLTHGLDKLKRKVRLEYQPTKNVSSQPEIAWVLKKHQETGSVIERVPGRGSQSNTFLNNKNAGTGFRVPFGP